MSNHYRYAIAPDGTLGLRESANRDYTHATCYEPQAGVHGGATAYRTGDPSRARTGFSFHGSLEQATKTAEQERRKGRVVHVVETHAVTAAEYRALKRGAAPADLIAAIQAERKTHRTTNDKEHTMTKQTAAKPTNAVAKTLTKALAPKKGVAARKEQPKGSDTLKAAKGRAHKYEAGAVPQRCAKCGCSRNSKVHRYVRNAAAA